MNPKAKLLTGGDRHIIRNIFGRQHVGISNLAAIRAVVAGRYRQLRKSPRGVRRSFFATVIHEHQANRNLYHAVTTGHF